ncbi:MAG TPA: SGNH/GDSL hydrolase family protein [Bryobacteraceae bacterium]|nr:SGNH/GDSL hydrolase family protein [Bryobacteraceae bacterium]HUO29661.1 SGNH/GDSL hydrolase family protein [Bryobacteraceae bacterium]
MTAALSVPSFAQDKSAGHWVPTWAAAPQQPFTLGPPPPPRPAGQTQTPPAAPPAFRQITSFHNQTIRMIVRTSLGGRRVRIELSNAYGKEPLVVGAAHVALRDKDSAILPASDRTLKFAGEPSCTIPPGALMLSDPVDLDVPKLADLVVSIYVPNEANQLTMHSVGLHTTYIVEGDAAGHASLPDASTSQSWYFLSQVEVLAPANAGAIVAFGDSITDGATSTPDTDRSWPSFLAARLQENRRTSNLAVVNEGISGNRILHDLVGTNALARFDRDVLSQPAVRWVIILEGINDIGFPFRAGGSSADAVSADDLIAGLRQLIERAHEHGIKVMGCTLTPFEGAAYYSETGETERQAVNHWILTGGAFDAVTDFDAVERDSANAKQIRADFNIRDHLHPNDVGYKAMADAIDLAVFEKK